ncbi:MAG: IS1 family transposase [Deltaproteobacteria bacterium]|nr:IS1 family transposase [Deltaproteobacteria bacterium]
MFGLTDNTAIIAAGAGRQEADTMSKDGAVCPRCGSLLAQKGGKTGNGKQRYRCQVCGKWFITNRTLGIGNDTRKIAVSLLCDGVPAPIVAKALREKCSRRWIYQLRQSLINGR